MRDDDDDRGFALSRGFPRGGPRAGVQSMPEDDDRGFPRAVKPAGPRKKGPAQAKAPGKPKKPAKNKASTKVGRPGKAGKAKTKPRRT